MEWKTYNPDKTNDGFEAEYKVENDTLYYMGRGANSFWDWMRCIFGSLLKPVKYCGSKRIRKGNEKEIKDKSNIIKIQPEWCLMAFRFYHHIMHVEKLEFNKVVFTGHSMGGAVGKIVYWLILEDKKYRDDFNFYLESYGKTFGSPKPSNKPIDGAADYYNCGDFVPWLPMWYEPGLRFLINKKWRPVWISHDDYGWRFEE